MFIRRLRTVHYIRNGDYLLQLIDFQQLSKFQNIPNLCAEIQIHQQMLPRLFQIKTKPLFIADINRVRILFFFFSQKLLILIECGL